MLKGTGQIVEWSVRDESLHSTAGCWLFRTLMQESPELDTVEMRNNVIEACNLSVKLEFDFIDKAFEMGEIEGYLPSDYKLQYSNGGRANLNINRFGNAVNQQFIPGLFPSNNPNAQTPLQRSLTQGTNQTNPLTNQLLSNQRTSPAAITNFQKYNQQKTNDLLVTSKWKRG